MLMTPLVLRSPTAILAAKHVVAATTGRAGACGCWEQLDNPGLNIARRHEESKLSIKVAACLCN